MALKIRREVSFWSKKLELLNCLDDMKAIKADGKYRAFIKLYEKVVINLVRNFRNFKRKIYYIWELYTKAYDYE